MGWILQVLVLLDNTNFRMVQISLLQKTLPSIDIHSSRSTSFHLPLRVLTNMWVSVPTEEPVIELLVYAIALLDTALTLVKPRTLLPFKSINSMTFCHKLPLILSRMHRYLGSGSHTRGLRQEVANGIR